MSETLTETSPPTETPASTAFVPIKTEFYANSNLYFGNPDHLKLKLTDHEVLKTMMKPENFMLIAGDLRDNCIIRTKTDEMKFTDKIFRKIWAMSNPIDSEGQWAEFYSRWIAPYTKDAAGKDADFTERIKLCIGDMDTHFEQMKKIYTVRDFVKESYSGSCYAFEKNGINFVCLSVYPNDDVIKYLKGLNLSKEQPMIVFWHYDFNTSDILWSTKSKQKILEVLKNYNVVLIINGHDHKSYTRNINYISERSIIKFKTVSVGGNEFAKITYEKKADQDYINIQLIDDNNNQPQVKYNLTVATNQPFINPKGKTNPYLLEDLTI